MHDTHEINRRDLKTVNMDYCAQEGIFTAFNSQRKTQDALAFQREKMFKDIHLEH